MRTQNTIARLRAGLVDGGSAPVQTSPDGWVESVPAEVVRQRIAASAVIPHALAVPCLAHSAAVGTPCFGRASRRGSGICGDRLARRSPRSAS